MISCYHRPMGIIPRMLAQRLCLLGVCVILGACSDVQLPDGRQQLQALMESEDLNVALKATQKLDNLYGMNALLETVRKGGTQARWLAASALQGHPAAEARGALLDSLNDQSAAVRSKAVIALRSMCDASCVPRIEPLLNDTDETVRIMAAATIREINAK
jgi:HEAT repeat protein